MQRFFCLLVGLSVLLLISAQKDNRAFLYVESVNFLTRTFTRITCEGFKLGFASSIVSKKITDSSLIDKLDQYLNKIEFSEDEQEIDVRGRFYFQKNERTLIIICANYTQVMVNGRIIIEDKQFADFLRSLTK